MRMSRPCSTWNRELHTCNACSFCCRLRSCKRWSSMLSVHLCNHFGFSPDLFKHSLTWFFETRTDVPIFSRSMICSVTPPVTWSGKQLNQEEQKTNLRMQDKQNHHICSRRLKILKDLDACPKWERHEFSDRAVTSKQSKWNIQHWT